MSDVFLHRDDVDRYVVIDPETQVRHGIRLYAPRDGRPAVMTVCDYGDSRLGEGAVLRDANDVGRANCLKCLAAATS